MEEIFSTYRTDVADNGFSERVSCAILTRLSLIPPPARSIYRIPTLTAAVATVAAIVIITLSIGLGTLNDKYEQLAQRLSHSDEIELCDNGFIAE